MKKNKGFTLFELLSAITITALVAAGLGSIFAGTLKVWKKAQNNNEALKEARTALRWITADLKQGVNDINNRIITFSGNDNIKINSLNGEVQYVLTGDTLNRISGGRQDLLAKSVSSIKFIYYDKNGNTTNELKSINFVSVVLTIDKKGYILQVEDGANLRNYVSPQIVVLPAV